MHTTSTEEDSPSLIAPSPSNYTVESVYGLQQVIKIALTDSTLMIYWSHNNTEHLVFNSSHQDEVANKSNFIDLLLDMTTTTKNDVS